MDARASQRITDDLSRRQPAIHRHRRERWQLLRRIHRVRFACGGTRHGWRHALSEWQVRGDGRRVVVAHDCWRRSSATGRDGLGVGWRVFRGTGTARRDRVPSGVRELSRPRARRRRHDTTAHRRHVHRQLE